MTSEADPARAIEYAHRYVAACTRLLDALNAALAIANNAVRARKMAEQRPQHEISIRNFAEMAERYDQQFPAPCKAFLEACNEARTAARDFRTAEPGDPELVLLSAVDVETYGQVGTAAHVLRATFGTTPSGFLDGLQAANAAIEADIFSYGEDGFVEHVYSPPASAAPERPCPWCAEQIKGAAILCRFCGRDVRPQSGSVEDHWNRLRTYIDTLDDVAVERDFGTGLILRVNVSDVSYRILAAQNGPNRVTFESGLGAIDEVDLRWAVECAAGTPGGVVCADGSVSFRSSQPSSALDRNAFVEAVAGLVRATSDYHAHT